MRELDDITGFHIHRDVGPGLPESVYQAVLARTTARRGFRVERQKIIRFVGDVMAFEVGFHADLVVDDRVIVELKSVEFQPSASPRLRVNHLVAARVAGSAPDHPHKIPKTLKRSATPWKRGRNSTRPVTPRAD